jgi:ABC-type protease/lipase transport system fused ATPase/permease subunit
MSHMVPARKKFRIPYQIIRETWGILRDPGQQGLEASAVWLARAVNGNSAEILSVWKPAQVARRTAEGVSVEVTQEGLSELIMSLPDDVFVAVRLHTHPGEAYHSEMDDTNMLISHEGAISIVVPFFASGSADLLHCSVNELRHQVGWVELDSAEVAAQFEVT